jgi:hypothetical protein
LHSEAYLPIVASRSDYKIFWYAPFYLRRVWCAGHSFTVLAKLYAFIFGKNPQYLKIIGVSSLESNEKWVVYFVALTGYNPLMCVLKLLRLEWRTIEVCVLLLMTASACKFSSR